MGQTVSAAHADAVDNYTMSTAVSYCTHVGMCRLTNRNVAARLQLVLHIGRVVFIFESNSLDTCSWQLHSRIALQ